MRILIFTFSILLLTACHSTKQVQKIDKTKETTSSIKISNFERLKSYMMGSFNSSAQAKKDTNYYDITLHMYPIWEGTATEQWLYVEQAITKGQNRPYRQRLYQLEQIDNETFRSRIYTLKDPKKYVLAWNKKDGFKDLAIDSADLKEGCAVILKLQKDGSFKGSTTGDACKSTLRGAAYATSEVMIKKDIIESWDRGFNQDDVHMWGAEKAGYIFQKIE